MDQQTLEFLPKLYDVALEAELPDVLQAFCQMAGADSATLHVTEAEHAPATHLSAASAALLRRSDALSLYLAQYAEAEAEGWSRVPETPGVVFSDEEVFGAGMSQRAEIQELERRLNIRQRAGLRFNVTPAWGDMMGVQYGRRCADALARTRAVMAPLFKHFRAVLAQIRRRSLLEERDRRFTAAMNRLDLPLIVLDAAGRAVFLNAAAEGYIESEGALTITPDRRLETASAERTAALNLAVAEALRTVRKESDAGAQFVVGEDRRGRPLRITIHPFADRDAREMDAPLGAVVEILAADGASAFSAQHFDVLYRLTPAELATARLMLEGRSTREIAEIRSVAIETTRTQIKRSLEKTGCKTRMDFLRLSAAINPPIRRKDAS